MDHMRQGINLRGYGQRDPLVEYKREAYRMYQEFNAVVAKQVVYSIYRVGVAAQNSRPMMRVDNVQLTAPAKEGDEGTSMEIESEGAHQKVGRNDPCPCGATGPDGRSIKYKRCHGKGD
jgi:preprotein translocase subunit SecA